MNLEYDEYEEYFKGITFYQISHRCRQLKHRQNQYHPDIW